MCLNNTYYTKNQRFMKNYLEVTKLYHTFAMLYTNKKLVG